MKRCSFLLFTLCISGIIYSQKTLLIPDQIFDGKNLISGIQVLVNGKQIEAIGKNLKSDAGTKIIQLKGKTLMPGIIEGHAHILLHPYNETSWNDQVLFESEAERVIRAGEHLQSSLLAGITTIRDLGTEGAGYADLGIKQAIQKGVIAAPDLICSGKAIVATGSYGPKSLAFPAPLGAEAADGKEVIRIVRDQIGHGVDLIKIYADNKESYFEKEFIPIKIIPTGEKEEKHIGNVIMLKNITSYKELDFAKTNFIGTVSHELKTPISSIKIFILPLRI